jgi:hypothetical protein
LISGEWHINSKFGIIFSKKDILISMLQNGIDFKSLYEYDHIKDLRFNKTLSFKNIFNYHLELVKRIINDCKRSIDDFDFYLANLVDIKESQDLVKEILNNTLSGDKKVKKKEIIIPNIYYKEKNKSFINFNVLFDINLNYNKFYSI